MKKLFSLIASLTVLSGIFAQSPDKMSYQAIIRNNSNNLVTSVPVGMKISILQGSADGTVVYAETQSPESNANGLVSIEIGTGTTTDDFSAIDWSGGPYYIKTETDPDGGANYTIVGVSQLLSVPYALYSETAGNVFSGSYMDLTNKPTFASVATSGSYNDLSDKPSISGSQWTTSGSNIYYNDGNVGIGTGSPATLLHAHGSPIPSRGQLSLSSPAGEGTFLSFYDADIFKAYLWYAVDEEDLRLQNFTSGDLNLNPYGGNVGIGTNTPGTTLEVNGQVKITGGTPAAGEVLTSDGTGLATWEPLTEDRVYFEVKKSSVLTWGGPDSKLIDFSTGAQVWENQGNDFNLSTNTFTAPEDGIYAFNGVIYFINMTPGSLIFAMLFAGNRWYEGAWAYSSSAYQGVSISMTLYLSAGQTAQLWGSCDDPAAQVSGNSSTTYAYTHFSGAKVN
ncbi:MAG: hypothetical protein P1P86_15065 [Bacteroidales bacterium]|nr:hypothetical protein [Bacteroidales bacterium]